MQNNNYQKQCTVIHSYTNTPTQAYFLEKLIYMYKITKYHFDNVKYFTRTRDQFTSELGLSARTISNHLSHFEKKGIIERTSRLIGAKKRLYIRLSDSFCALLGLEPELTQENTHKTPNEAGIGEGTPTSKNTTKTGECVFLNQLCPTEMAKNARTYNEINNNINQKPNSTVSEDCIVNTCQKDPKDEAAIADKSTQVEKVIGERITDRLKNYIKGMLSNLQAQHKLKFSEPEKLYAEIVFSVLNTKEQLTGIDNPHHRVNIIAKLLRERRWSTPKGFYNHWDVGQLFKKKERVRANERAREKALEGVLSENGESGVAQATYEGRGYQKPQDIHNERHEVNRLKGEVNQLMGNIRTEESYLSQLEHMNALKKGAISSSLIDDTAIKIAKMYEHMQSIQDKLALYTQAMVA